MKWDGIRAIATVTRGSARFATRNGIDVTATYPDLQQLAGDIAGDAVLDGEIVALNDHGRPDFGLLQRRMKLVRAVRGDGGDRGRAPPVHGVRHSRAARAIARRRDVRRAPSNPARQPGAVGPHPDPGRVPGRPRGGHRDEPHARSRGCDGETARQHLRRWPAIASLDQDQAPRYPGGRDRWMAPGGRPPLKLRRLTADGCSGRERPAIMSAAWARDSPTTSWSSWRRRLRRLSRKTSPFADVPRDVSRDAVWVTPSLVGEVEFAEWTSAGRLRQPSWRGWRPDKIAEDVVREGA